MATMIPSDNSANSANGRSNGGNPNIVLRPGLHVEKESERKSLSLGNITACQTREIDGYKWRPAPDGTRAAELTFLGTETPEATPPQTITTTIKPEDWVSTDNYSASIEIEGAEKPAVEFHKYIVIVTDSDNKEKSQTLWGSQQGIKLFQVENYYNPISIARIDPNEKERSAFSSENKTVKFYNHCIDLKDGNSLQGYTTFDPERNGFLDLDESWETL